MNLRKDTDRFTVAIIRNTSPSLLEEVLTSVAEWRPSFEPWRPWGRPVEGAFKVTASKNVEKYQRNLLGAIEVARREVGNCLSEARLQNRLPGLEFIYRQG